MPRYTYQDTLKGIKKTDHKTGKVTYLYLDRGNTKKKKEKRKN